MKTQVRQSPYGHCRIAVYFLVVGSINTLVWSAEGAPGTQPATRRAPGPDIAAGIEIPPAQREAITRGLSWLVKQHDANGALRAMRGEYPVGQTALAGLAYLAAGAKPREGEYGWTLQRAIEYVAAQAQESGLIVQLDRKETRATPMYEHGFSVLFLAEVYRSAEDQQLKDRLKGILIKGVGLIEKAQNSFGGWRYEPTSDDADISVTACQLTSLRAARRAGIAVKQDTMNLGVAFVQMCHQHDGGFGYRHFPVISGPSRTGPAVAILYHEGFSQLEATQAGLMYLRKNIATATDPIVEGWMYYTQYYCTQAMFAAGGEDWANWYEAMSRQLVKLQRADGSWQASARYGITETQFAVIALLIPDRRIAAFNLPEPNR